MAKKRYKARSKRPIKKTIRKKIVKKSKSSNKKFVPIVFVVGFIIIILLLCKNRPLGKIIVTNLELEEGEKTLINFDIKHTFSTEKECYAEVLLFKGNDGISYDVVSLGYIQPNQVVSKSLELYFPERNIDFRIDIDCK